MEYNKINILNYMGGHNEKTNDRGYNSNTNNCNYNL